METIAGAAAVAFGAGVAGGIIGGAVAAVLEWVRTPIDANRLSHLVDIQVAVRADLLTAAVVAAFYAVVGGLISAWLLGLSAGIAVALALLTIRVGAAAAVWYLGARIFASITNLLPHDLPQFLEAAHRYGLLRRTGAAYQFRHEHIRRRLLNRIDGDGLPVARAEVS